MRQDLMYIAPESIGGRELDEGARRVHTLGPEEGEAAWYRWHGYDRSTKWAKWTSRSSGVEIRMSNTGSQPRLTIRADKESAYLLLFFKHAKGCVRVEMEGDLRGILERTLQKYPENCGSPQYTSGRDAVEAFLNKMV